MEQVNEIADWNWEVDIFAPLGAVFVEVWLGRRSGIAHPPTERIRAL
jgi:hypothetical protein